MHTREEEPQDPTKKYDTRDLPMDGIIKGVVGFFIFTALMAPAGWFSMHWLGGQVDRPYLGQEPLPLHSPTSYENRSIPGDPNPILQDNFTVKSDIHNLRKEAREVLHNSAVNPTTKTKTIPIETAIEEEAAENGN